MDVGELFGLNFGENLLIVVINLESSNIRKANLLICVYVYVNVGRGVGRLFVEVIR